MSAGKSEVLRWTIGAVVAVLLWVAGSAWSGGSAATELRNEAKNASDAATEARKGVADHEPRLRDVEKVAAVNSAALVSQAETLRGIRADLTELLKRIPPR